jgi:hypothetical protein
MTGPAQTRHGTQWRAYRPLAKRGPRNPAALRAVTNDSSVNTPISQGTDLQGPPAHPQPGPDYDTTARRPRRRPSRVAFSGPLRRFAVAHGTMSV